MCAEEFVYLRARATRPGKVTLVSAQQAAAYWDPEKSGAAYPTREAYLADLVRRWAREGLDDGTGIVAAAFAQWLNGKQELVYPKEHATTPLAYPAPPYGKR